jgi:HSP20 family protein
MILFIKRNGTYLPRIVTDFLDTEKKGGKEVFEMDGDLIPEDLISNVPSANITEHPNDYLIELAAPGLLKEDFHVQLEDDILSVTVERNAKNIRKDGVVHREFSYDKFKRTFRLPENGRTEELNVTYEAGILRISIPKKEAGLIRIKKMIAVA